MPWENVYTEVAARSLFGRLRESKDRHFEGTRCIEFTGCRNEHGYGVCRMDGRKVYTHRALMELVMKRRLTKGEVVMHRCDNRACANPEHLKVGSQAENVRDALQKGALNPHSKEPQAGLTHDDVVLIKLRLHYNHPVGRIARDMGIGTNTVRDVRDGKTWKDVVPPKAMLLDKTPPGQV